MNANAAVLSVMAALSASGLPTDSFTFLGFPVRKKNKREQQLQKLAEVPHTLVFYQSPRRVIAFLEEILAVLGDRPAVLARELTKLHEEFLRGTVSDIISQLKPRSEVKGECTLLVGGAETGQADLRELDAAIAEALARSDQSLSELCRNLARRFGVPRKEIYAKALAVKSGETPRMRD